MQIVYEPDNLLEAHLVKGLLAQVGIEAWVRGEHLLGAMGELPAIGLLAIMVGDGDAVRAREVIEDWSQAEVPPEESGDDGSFLA